MKVSLLFQKHHVYFFYFYGTAWKAFSYCLHLTFSVLLVLSSLCRKRKDINSVNLFPCKWESEITKKRDKSTPCFEKHAIGKGAVICGACRLRHYKCRPCSDRQATCEHYVVSDDKDYQPPTKKGKEPMKSPYIINGLTWLIGFPHQNWHVYFCSCWQYLLCFELNCRFLFY
jgi:hypothetical protein